MSKELTEQYRNGTLPSDFYYFTNGKDFYTIEHHQLKGMPAIKGVEVVATVPTYAEFKHLMSNFQYVDKCRELTEKVEELEWRIEELEQQNAFECECNKEYADTLEKNEQLEKQLKEANAIIKSLKDARSQSVNEYIEKYGV